MSLKYEPASEPLHISVIADAVLTGLVFKAHRRVYHSTLGSRVINQTKKLTTMLPAYGVVKCLSKFSALSPPPSSFCCALCHPASASAAVNAILMPLSPWLHSSKLSAYT